MPVAVRELELDLDAFEGPFDLLLSLVLREELSAADLPHDPPHPERREARDQRRDDDLIRVRNAEQFDPAEYQRRRERGSLGKTQIGGPT